MKKENISDALNNIDFDMVEDAYKSGVNGKPAGRRQWLKWGMAAACLVLVITAATSSSVFFNSGSKPYTPVLIDPAAPPDTVVGSSIEFVVGSSTSVRPSVSEAPPPFEFVCSTDTNIAVKAKFVQSLPDSYYMLNVSSVYKPTEYRVLEFQTEEVLHGTNIPDKFYYLIESSLFADFTQYDSFIISMWQEGAKNYVMRNGTKSRMEAFSMPVFSNNRTELGNMIAFTDGIFDERLWQNESWLFGYQFIRSALDDEEYCKQYEVMYRGCTEEYTKEKILGKVQEYADWLGENYAAPSAIDLNFESDAAKAVLEYVKPFENGVFSQRISYGGEVVFRRYINGCETEEVISVNAVTEEVSYSEVRYTDEDMECMEDIAAHIAALSAQYREKRPAPPRTDPTGKNLTCLNLFGWYAKAEGRVYGVIKTVWIYMADGDWSTAYYDDTYTLFDAKAGYAKTVSREELMNLIGVRNLYRGDYKPIELPQC